MDSRFDQVLKNGTLASFSGSVNNYSGQAGGSRTYAKSDTMGEMTQGVNLALDLTVNIGQVGTAVIVEMYDSYANLASNTLTINGQNGQVHLTGNLLVSRAGFGEIRVSFGTPNASFTALKVNLAGFVC